MGRWAMRRAGVLETRPALDPPTRRAGRTTLDQVRATGPRKGPKGEIDIWIGRTDLGGDYTITLRVYPPKKRCWTGRTARRRWRGFWTGKRAESRSVAMRSCDTPSWFR